MLMYALICLTLVLVGVAGLQFTYLFYLDRVYRERQKYLQNLELRHAELKTQFADARRQLQAQDKLISVDSTGEEWAEVIEER